MADPLILAFDTSGPWCSVALWRGTLVDSETVAMDRGQAEALFPRIEALLAANGFAWADCEAYACGTGPGNFTGVRISVAAARGLSLATGNPAVGVSGFEAMHDPSGLHGGTELVLLEIRSGLWLQAFRDGSALGTPRLIDPEAPAANLLGVGFTVRGHRARAVARHFGMQAEEAVIEDMGARVAEVAARKLREGCSGGLPAPVYLRAADAAPPRDPPPVILA